MGLISLLSQESSLAPQFKSIHSSAFSILYCPTLTVEEGNGNPLQYSCLENPMDGGAWWTIVCRVAKSQTRLSKFSLMSYTCPNKRLPLFETCFPFSLSSHLSFPTNNWFLQEPSFTSKSGL